MAYRRTGTTPHVVGYKIGVGLVWPIVGRARLLMSSPTRLELARYGMSVNAARLLTSSATRLELARYGMSLNAARLLMSSPTGWKALGSAIGGCDFPNFVVRCLFSFTVRWRYNETSSRRRAGTGPANHAHFAPSNCSSMTEMTPAMRTASHNLDGN